MKIEVSNGEILDKISILEIKLKKITDDTKIINIKKEYEILLESKNYLLDKYPISSMYDELFKINLSLWKIEESIRECEYQSDFGPKFIELARNVYITNDMRSFIKKEINIITNSDVIEEKSYNKLKY